MLAYGIATAAVLRFVMIAAGAQLIERFQPTLLAFAAVLLFSAYKIVARSDDEEEEDLASNSIVRLCRCAWAAALPEITEEVQAPTFRPCTAGAPAFS